MYPILFTLPWVHVPIYSYGTMLGLSFLVGWLLIRRLGGAGGTLGERWDRCYLYTVISGIIGARLLYLFTNSGVISHGGWLAAVDLSRGGMVAYGGFVGGFLGSWLYLSSARLPLSAFADAAAFALASGLGITRIGCFLYGCCWGKPISQGASSFVQFIGVRFPNWTVQAAGVEGIGPEGSAIAVSLKGSPAFLHHLSLGWVGPVDPYSLYVYPVQILESLNGWIAFLMLLVARKRIRVQGKLFCLFIMYYGLTRTGLEFLRGDVQRGELWGISTSQWIGLVTFALSAMMYRLLSHRAVR